MTRCKVHPRLDVPCTICTGHYLTEPVPWRVWRSEDAQHDRATCQQHNWCRWMNQAVQRLKDAGEWNEAGPSGTDTQAQEQSRRLDPADRDSPRHGDKVE